MIKAGYDPEGMIQLFRRFKQTEKRRKNTFLSQFLVSHPPSPDRIARVEEHSKSSNLGDKKLVFGEEEYKKIKSGFG